MLEDVVARELTEHRATIAVAESCTGRNVGERLDQRAGQLAYFRGGVVSYSNDLKTAWSNVPREIIEKRRGELRGGPRTRRWHSPTTGATLGIGITGIAGPGGGTPEKPVGLVHIAIADERGPRRSASPLSPAPRTHTTLKRRMPRSTPCADIFRIPRTRRGQRVRLFVALDVPDEVRSAW